jgi:hypothetical protein
MRKRGSHCSAPIRQRPARGAEPGVGVEALQAAPGTSWAPAGGPGLELVTGRPVIVDDRAESERKVSFARERNRVLGRGVRTGKSFEVQADESAWYEVVHVGPTSVEVEWRDYGRDRCMDEMLGAGGEFPRALIERLVHRHDVLEELAEAWAQASG